MGAVEEGRIMGVRGFARELLCRAGLWKEGKERKEFIGVGMQRK